MAVQLSNNILMQGYVKDRLRSSLRKFYGRGSYPTIWGPLLPYVTRHSGWRPYTVTPSIHQTLQQFCTLLLIWTLLPNLTLYLIARGFQGAFARDAACQQWTLTPPDTWSCHTLGLASVLMLRPISPELVLFSDFRVSNIAIVTKFNAVEKHFTYMGNIGTLQLFTHDKPFYNWLSYLSL